mgnify:CR=1 FL=1
MTYRCQCKDGPAQGTEFWDYGPPVSVELPRDGRVLKYRLSDIQTNHCVYEFIGCDEEESDSTD